ncbi:phage tail family protein [Rossellomorea marisflavi]|uniref:phage distal tail protein n=1 Tax=Rossellomorea marisflavi TaxID=189381 RepID=UPI0025B004CB|nr:phage tail domain-containing protein [Rossellomorea marisflavi]WJV20680.1 phage tail family protein [Rossellomorea marisflavi]
MIRESLYFSFAGRKSTEFPIINVSLGSGLFEEPLTSPKSIVETSVSGNNTPYFQRVKRDPLTFSLRFGFTEPWNDEMIDDIIRWLDVDYYEPLYFSPNIDRIFYAMVIDSIEQVHNGLKEGYVNLNIRCNGSYKYSPEISTPIYEIEESDIIEIENLGHLPVLPIIYIQKVGDGSITIENLSTSDEVFSLKNLKNGEELKIDCEARIIETNQLGLQRYNDFNDNYLEISYGYNEFIVKGQCKIKLEYQFLYK